MDGQERNSVILDFHKASNLNSGEKEIFALNFNLSEPIRVSRTKKSSVLFPSAFVLESSADYKIEQGLGNVSGLEQALIVLQASLVRTPNLSNERFVKGRRITFKEPWF